jgi:hypothetical protein
MMRLSLQRRSDPSAAQLGSRQVALSKQEYELENRARHGAVWGR